MSKVKTEFWKYLFLGVLGMLGSAGTILADAFFVSGRLGATGLASMNIAICIFGIINGMGLLFGIGGATRYTILRAKEDKANADRTFVLSFLAALIVGGSFTLMGVMSSKQISYLLGADADTIVMCNIYLKTILCFAPAFVLNHLLMAFVRNDGDPGLSTRAMMIGSITNIVLDYVFMYPLNMGIFGAAMATGFAALIGIGISCLHFLSPKNHLHFMHTRVELKEIIKITSFGLSAFTTEFSSGVVLVAFNLLILRIAGNTGVAAYGIVANLALMVLAVMSGISHGIQPLLSKMYGMGDSRSVKQLYYKGVRFTFLLGSAVFAAAFSFAPGLVQFFNRDGNDILQILAERGIQLYFIGFVFVGYNYLTTAYFSATEKPQQAFVVASFRGFFGIVTAAYFLATHFNMTGIWAAFPAVEAITISLCMLLRHKENRLTN